MAFLDQIGREVASSILGTFLPGDEQDADFTLGAASTGSASSAESGGNTTGPLLGSPVVSLDGVDVAQSSGSVPAGPGQQPLALSPALRSSVVNFLGFDPGDPRYFQFDRIPPDLQGPGTLGFAGTVRTPNGEFAVAAVDEAQVKEWAGNWGVNANALLASVITQEITSKTLLSHPSVAGKLDAPARETVGEAMSFQQGGADFLPLHLAFAGQAELGNNRQAAYSAYKEITTPIVGDVLKRNGIDASGSDFLKKYANFAIDRATGRTEPGNDPNVLKDFLITEYKVSPEKAGKIAGDLLAALSPAYQDKAQDIIADARRQTAPT